MEVIVQTITPLGLTELSADEMAVVTGGETACWCKSLARSVGYGIGYVVGAFVDALVSPEDDNSFLGK
jgi:hypothetical protein